MDDNIKKIYDMMYSPIITPYNLLENAKLENYSYVKYYTESNNMVAEIEFEISGEGRKIFYYYFDKNDFLEKVCTYQGTYREVIFDRKSAIEEAKEEYFKTRENINAAG